MPIIFNGITLATLDGDMVHNGINCTAVYMNGILVWNVTAAPASQTFNADGTFTVPIGIVLVTIEMVGGGGGGSTTDDRSAGGGHRGGIYNSAIAVTPGQLLKIEIGAAGIGAPKSAYTYGTAGGTSYVRDNATLAVLASASGGGRGTLTNPVGNDPGSCSWQGNGGSYVSPLDAITYFDGLQKTGGRYMGGGQAGPYGNGSNAGTNANAPANSGAGGGGASKHVSGGAGNGGTGKLVISW